MNSRSRGATPSPETEFATSAAGLITETVEHVFTTVQLIRDHFVALHRAAFSRAEQMGAREVDAVRDQVLALLTRDDEIAVGMGVIMAPDLVAGPSLRLEWWQRDSARDVPVRLDVDLNPASVDFYDYLSADWFRVPRRTGNRHIVGPYVDVHGTDRYVLTLTMPIPDGSDFLGVAGADVPLARLEGHLLRQLGAASADIVVVNEQRRVVLSSSPQWLTGSLVTAGDVDAPDVVDVVGTPWRLLVIGD